MVEPESYRGIVTACLMQFGALFFDGIVLLELVAFVGSGNFVWLLFAAITAPIAVLTTHRMWPLCYRATLDDHGLTFRQLTGTRRAALSDVQRITTARYGEGSGTLFIMHLTKGRATVAEKRGRAFVDAVFRAAPAEIATKGWVPSRSAAKS